MKKILILTFLIIFGFMFSGCLGNNPKINNTLEDKSNAIAYAHMKNGDSLIGIYDYELNDINKKIESIVITENGFRPSNYFEYYRKDQICDKSLILANQEQKICHGRYSVFSGGLVSNAFINVLLLGLPVATGTIFYDVKYSEERFNKVVKNNNLPSIRKFLLEIIKIQNHYMDELNSLYSLANEKYIKNKEKIILVYDVENLSGLFINEKLDFNKNIKIILNNPKPLDYSHEFKNLYFSKNINKNTNFDSLLIETKENMNELKEKLKKEYSKYLDTNFKNYLLEIKNPLKLKNNTSFDIEVEIGFILDYKKSKSNPNVKIPLILKNTNLNK